MYYLCVLKLCFLFSFCYLFPFWDFLHSFILVFIFIVSSSGDLDTSSVDFSFALTIASTILDIFPSYLFYPLIYFIVLGAIYFRLFLLFFNPIVVSKISSYLSYRLAGSYTSMSALSFNKVSLSEFRTVLTEIILFN